ncbi:MAG: hypothetical protein A2655_04345 [Candidatus Yanofskybacteria bacterium RIFCSPHIGHO2_01_FULL_43_42]|uniref:Peptidase n=1 Tax=Candidatus Yanofskybacteria bacterium RIFCSPLOWO2_01_FULL_43_22 TaxID=1802695 RepID=A0A1F8GD97_9BACT|nr:MAG: hypothetical protein A2655_04345 [Candidatus Yanofskybacteria bacterium RIFCSPHIGHO2_01_FULL_43_42]OGN12720.1 MAG: hypothetical protein A3D48_01695 [Candidatus Yanofskybacteria bacterium RIFCSPHIGHO2_02_FULL_43_17]OGN23342.1 MAG: hypothetical protein A3A13_04465 [Candidatus Yanofskybacteria bacterium RIFCSPLOWO2_01_FULL_43_22]
MTIQDRLARVRFFGVKPDLSSLGMDQRQALAHCVNASRIMTDIYLEQRCADNKRIYRELRERSDAEGKDLLRYFLIHGSPWDAYDHNHPFILGVGKKPKFGSFYPADLTRSEWDAWLNAHPEDCARFESNFTVVRRQSDGLVARPYSEEYADQLSEAANLLRQAATLLPDSPLRSFLQLRANAFLSNDYFESDMAWVDTDGSPFEVTIGPYETYFDELLGLKASFEAFVALPDKDATAALARFTPVVPDFDVMLSQEFDFRPKGAAIPLEVVADVARGGECGFGYMFVAYNLPNDRRVHDLKGSKKVFSRTMMEAKFSTLALPIAERLLAGDLLDLCTFGNKLLFVLGHELAHGLGPSKIQVNGKEMPFEVALKDLYSSIEEAKADMLGARLLNYFRSRNLLDDETLRGIIATEVVAYFQGWRHGFTEAHARGSLIEYNWLRAADALRYNSATKQYEIDPMRCIDAMSKLSTEFLNLQIAGDYERAEAFMKHWGFVPSELPPIIESLSDIPTAVSPVWDLSELQ